MAEICICIQFKNPSICLDLILIQPQVDILNNFLDATQKFCQLVIPVHSDDDPSYLAKKSGVKIILNFQQKYFCLVAGTIVALYIRSAFWSREFWVCAHISSKAIRLQVGCKTSFWFLEKFLFDCTGWLTLHYTAGFHSKQTHATFAVPFAYILLVV